MAVRVDSAEFTDDTRLFYSKQSANTWRLNLTVPTSAAAKEGVVLKCSHVGDITTIDGTTILQGTNAPNHLTMGTLDFTNDANVKTAFTILSEKINHLTYRLEQAGIMSSTD